MMSSLKAEPSVALLVVNYIVEIVLHLALQSGVIQSKSKRHDAIEPVRRRLIENGVLRRATYPFRVVDEAVKVKHVTSEPTGLQFELV